MTHDFFYFVKAKKFFNEYAPAVKNWTKKLTGTVYDGVNPAMFTKADRAAIEKGKQKYISDLQNKKTV